MAFLLSSWLPLRTSPRMTTADPLHRPASQPEHAADCSWRHASATRSCRTPETSNRPIIDTFVNTNRYVKTDNNSTVFTTKEVLQSILKKYGAYVVQENGKWNIVRLEHYFSKETQVVFIEFDSDGIATGVQEGPDRILLLGSQINNFYPHHASANQQKFYNVALGAYKVLYEYGLVKSIILNRNVYYDDDQGNIQDWVITDNDFQISRYFKFGDISLTPPGYPNGYFIGEMFPTGRNQDFLALKSTSLQTVQENSSLKINISSFVTILRGAGEVVQFVQITITGTTGNIYYLNQEGGWIPETPTRLLIFTVTSTSLNSAENIPAEFAGITEGAPESGTLEVHFYLPKVNIELNTWVWSRLAEVNITQVDNGIRGESHTTERGFEDLNFRTVTAVVEDDGNIYVGDNPLTDAYVGGIENDIGENTLAWSKGFIDSISIDTSTKILLLEWLVRDRLQISSGNALNFSGGIYGYFPYLGVITIDNIGTRGEPIELHRFMTTAWSYDLTLNLIAANFERIYNKDVSSDVSYVYELETDNTVIRPAIKG